MIKTFIPKSKVLQQYIESFYVFKNNVPEKFSFIAFPHINTSISFFKGISLTRKNYSVTIQSELSKPNTYSVEILGKFIKPVFVQYNGAFEEIAIVFKPLGINQFIPDYLHVAPNFSQALTINAWNELSPILFTEKNLRKRVQILEGFLLKNQNKVSFENIHKALSYLENVHMDYSIKEIASFSQMNVKTFHRLFFKIMACTPIEYKRIARFRNSLNSKLFAKDIISLTKTAYDSNYYDQSYFIREYKKLTNLNPGKFFEAVSLLDEKKIVWKVL